MISWGQEAQWSLSGKLEHGILIVYTEPAAWAQCTKMRTCEVYHAVSYLTWTTQSVLKIKESFSQVSLPQLTQLNCMQLHECTITLVLLLGNTAQLVTEAYYCTIPCFQLLELFDCINQGKREAKVRILLSSISNFPPFRLGSCDNNVMRTVSGWRQAHVNFNNQSKLKLIIN